MDKILYSFAEMGLDKVKNRLSLFTPALYGQLGYVNLGTNPDDYMENATVILKLKVFGQIQEDMAVYFVPLYQKPFVVYTAGGIAYSKVVGYFDYAKTVFEKFGYDRDYKVTGLVVETAEKVWEVMNS